MTDPNRNPELVTRAEALNRLASQDPETIALLQELAENVENPEYTPRTYGQVFAHPDGIHVGDTVYPEDFPGLADKPIVPDDYKAPGKAVLRLGAQLQRIQTRLGKALGTFDRRSTQRARAHVRGIKGGKRMVEEHNHRLQINRLRPFSGQSPHNELRQGKRGFDVSLGAVLPTVNQPLFKLPKDGDGYARKLQCKAKEVAQLYAQNLLDHTQSVVMASSTVTGHDKVTRLVQLRLQFTTADGDAYEAEYTQLGQKRGVLTEPTAIPTHEGPLADTIEIGGQLSYEFRCPRSKVGEVTQVLAFLENLPVFRAVSEDEDADEPMVSDNDLFGEIEADEPSADEDAAEQEERNRSFETAAPETVPTLTHDELVDEIEAAGEEDTPVPAAAMALLEQFEEAGVAPELPDEDDTTIPPAGEDEDDFSDDEIFGFDFTMPDVQAPAGR